MNKVMSTLCLYLIFSVILSCKENDETEPLVLPTDLQLNVVVANDASGKVNIEASALNANFYTIFFGENANETPVKTFDGKANYTYSKSGEYIIRVQANATASNYIEEDATVTINLTDATSSFIPTTGYTSPSSYNGLTLVWEDDFSGSTLNSNNWSYEIGRGSNGWGNNELQYYRQENTSIVDGHLVITAKKENFSGAEYTSSRLITKDKRTFQYGRVDIRAALPKGQGIWPAFWMLGANFPTVGWPKCGEIDIMEMIGGTGRDNTVYGTLHWDNNGSHACTCGG